MPKNVWYLGYVLRTRLRVAALIAFIVAVGLLLSYLYELLDSPARVSPLAPKPDDGTGDCIDCKINVQLGTEHK